MKVLVTGGAGFIGSHIVDGFIKEGYNVVIIDDLSTGREENINSKAIFYQADIRSQDIAKIFDKEEPDILCHYAAQIDVQQSIENPVYDVDINIVGSINLFENACRTKVKKIIFASSGGAIYGEVQKSAPDESAPVNLISPYAIGKFAVEQYAKFYADKYNMDFVALRYANIYGPRQDALGEGGVVAIFINRMLSNQRPIIYGDGNQLRDFVYVKDVVRANILSIKKSNVGIVNIATGIPISINELFKRLSILTGYKDDPGYTEERKGDIKKSFLDATKAKNKLGWSAKYNLEMGLRETIKFFRKK